MGNMAKVELPDFDDLVQLVNKIYNLSQEKASLEIKIKIGEREAVEKGMEIIKVDGKKPSMAYIESTVKVTGIDGELVPLREKLLKLNNEIDYYKDLLEIYKLKIEVWRTMSANERASNI